MSFTVLSPDGIPIAPTTYHTRDEAWVALAVWCLRYVPQGFYASVKGHVLLEDLPTRCAILDNDTGSADDPAVELLRELADYFDDRMDITWEGGPNDAMTWHRRITDIVAWVKDDRCPECARSYGPHYRGPCVHGGGR